MEPEIRMEPQQTPAPVPSPYMVPMAIVIAGALIAGSIFYSGGSRSGVANIKDAIDPTLTADDQGAKGMDSVKPITKDDHILGDPNAPVKIVEFSDLECPFCKRFHDTTKQVMDEYGKSGKVALVFRHFPLEQLHPKAPKEAEATECAYEQGGNAKFWDYTNRIFEVTPSNNGLDLNLLPKFAEDLGLNRAQFESCLSSGKYKDKVQPQYDDAVASGGTGTPYSIVIAPNGKKFVVSGAQPYSAVKTIIEQALKEN